ncbi:hypothetical protein [Actinacidiphila acididurans]|uniref:Uncharacterized protein n=1 Tax=Actinacidiphila acididurans TaxID=2784346 RepID=A0ABS2U357_9ACTN|nr:hypothetical protein [Actinacidiphila acididurans]MBM9510033.1 hypothetical protein [Actinacidiphila acididurans]
MAALHFNPPVSDLISLKEGVALLADTGHPVTYKQLAHQLRGVQRERRGLTDYYRASDVFVAHRDLVDRTLN